MTVRYLSPGVTLQTHNFAHVLYLFLMVPTVTVILLVNIRHFSPPKERAFLSVTYKLNIYDAD
jgi:hypothetical protein